MAISIVYLCENVLCTMYQFLTCCFPVILESGQGGASHKEVMKLRKQNQLLSEENNLLKLKIDVLLDMVNISIGPNNCNVSE